MIRASCSAVRPARLCLFARQLLPAGRLLARPLRSSLHSEATRRPRSPSRPVAGRSPDQSPGHALAEAVFTLKGKSESDPAMRAALERVHVVLTTGANPLILQPETIGLLLNGLSDCSSASPLVSSVLAAIVPSVQAAPPGAFREILSSIQSGTASRPQVSGHPVAGRGSDQGRGHAFAEAVFVLKGKSESDPVMRAALERARGVLTTGPNPPILRPKSVGLLLNGLRDCSSASPLVSSVLAAVIPSVRAAQPGAFGARDVSMALYGLKSCSSAVPEVRAVLKAMAPKIVGCTETLNAQGVGNALYGLKSLQQ
jgi:hypothetical protein